MAQFLTKEQIFSAQDIKTEPCDVPEWGGTIQLKMLTALERVEFERLTTQEDGTPVHWWELYKITIAMHAVDDDMRPLFTVEEAEALGKRSIRACHRVFHAAIKLSKLTKDDLEEMVKNFDDGQASASSTS